MFMSSTAKDFDNLADEVVNSFLNESVPLETSIIKVAGREALNPEEVKRLVEKANTSTAIKLIKISTEGSVEFSLADYSSVVGKTHSDTPTASFTEPITQETTKTAMLNTIDKVDIFSLVFPKKPVEKVASDAPNLKEVFKSKVALEVLGRKKIAAELRFKKSADSLLSEFSSLYAPDFNKFACEAYTLYGDTALPILDALAADIREPTEFSKVAHIIDDVQNKQLNLFKEAYASLTEICQHIDSIATGKGDLDKAWAELRSGHGAN